MDPKLTTKSQEALAAALQGAASAGNAQLEPVHLLAALLAQPGGVAGGLLDAVGVDRPALAHRVSAVRTTRDALAGALPAVRGSARVTTPDPEGTYKALEQYGIDLTAAAREGRLDPVIGRDSEIRRVVQVLSRRTKNNPV